MLVSMWMSPDPITIAQSATIADAAVELSRRRVRRLLVADRTERGVELRGIVSLHDVTRAFPPDVNPLSVAAGDLAAAPAARRLGPAARPLAEIMTRHVHTVTPETPIEEAAQLLLRHKVGALPVVRDGLVIGIITESDIFKAFLEVVGPEAGVRVTFDLAADEDPVALVAELGARHAMRIASVLTLVHEGRRLAVVRLIGGGADAFVDAIWRSGHRVASVLRTGRRSA